MLLISTHMLLPLSWKILALDDLEEIYVVFFPSSIVILIPAFYGPYQTNLLGIFYSHSLSLIDFIK